VTPSLAVPADTNPSDATAVYLLFLKLFLFTSEQITLKTEDINYGNKEKLAYSSLYVTFTHLTAYSYIKVIGSRSRSQDQKACLYILFADRLTSIKGILVLFNIFPFLLY